MTFASSPRRLVASRISFVDNRFVRVFRAMRLRPAEGREKDQPQLAALLTLAWRIIHPTQSHHKSPRYLPQILPCHPDRDPPAEACQYHASFSNRSAIFQSSRNQMTRKIISNHAPPNTQIRPKTPLKRPKTPDSSHKITYVSHPLRIQIPLFPRVRSNENARHTPQF